MRKPWVLLSIAGFSALAIWPNEAMAKWYACQTDGPKEYATALFEVSEDAGSGTWERIKEDFRSWLRNSPQFPTARNDAYKYGILDCSEQEFFERRIDPNRYVPTGWVPSMGRGLPTRSSATPAPRSRSMPATPRPAPAAGPLADEVANRTRLNAAQAAAAKRQREQIEATLAAKRAADAKHLSDKAKYQRDKAAIEAENARRAAAYKAAQADYERKLVEHKAAVEAMKDKKAAKGEDCRFETRQKLASGQAKALADAKSAALREFERQKAITIQMSNTVVSSGSMSCKGGPTRAGGVEMETDYSCSVPIVIKAKVCTAKPASASKQ